MRMDQKAKDLGYHPMIRTFSTQISLLCLILFVLPANTALADEPAKIDTIIPEMMDQVRRNKPIRGLTDAQLKVAKPQEFLSLMRPYEKDVSFPVRRLTYRYLWRLANLHPTREVRQAVTSRLLEGYIKRRATRQEAIWLMTFGENDFSAVTKGIIRQALTKDASSRRLIRFCGIANIHEELPRLQKLLIDESEYKAKTAPQPGIKKWYYTLGWNARLARARMGVKEDIERCIQLVEAEENATERVLRLLPDVGYIRQSKAIKCLK